MGQLKVYMPKITNRTAKNIDPEELLKEADKEVLETQETPEPTEVPVEEEKPIEEEKEEVVEIEAPVIEEQETRKEDYKEKFSQSSREATALHFKNQKLEQLMDEAVETKEPTDEEMIAYAKLKGADYNDLDDFSKSMLRDTFKNSRSLEKIRQAREESRKVEVWADRVEAFVNSEANISKYPSLEDLKEEFKKFCMKDSRRGMDLEDLVGSFMFDAPTPTIKRNKGSLLLSNSNGRVAPERPAGLTADEVSVIRVKNPKEYRRLIKEGKINIEL